jgi:hypothetical protein
MSSAPYEQKNSENFEATTRLLNEALKKIEKDISRRVNVTELARTAGVHRNTIYQRQWPLEKLAVIKENRKQQIADEAAVKTEELSPQQRLELSRLEIIYWFTELQEARASVASLKREKTETEKSRNTYMALARQRLEINNQKGVEIEKLRHVVTLLEEEIAALRGKQPFE